MTHETLLAPAKLTLSLRVTGICERDPFRGYHLIDAVMTVLDLHDVLEIEELPVGSPSRVTYTGRYSSGLDGSSGTDLVSRALHAVGRSANVTVTKNIPHGGGLGGGSADAAAILRWAVERDARLDVASIAVSLGADVVFCASGHGRARVSGIGDVIEPLTDDPGPVTLIVPPFSVSTPTVYRAFDENPQIDNPGFSRRVGSEPVSGLNDLEEPALRVEPRLAEWKARITEACGASPTLAGSGATWFVLGDHADLAARLPEATVVVTQYR